MHKYRTHNCSQLNKANITEKVKISGWLHSRRDHGGLLFLDIRDHFGITQVVIDEENSSLKIADFNHIKLESVLTILGFVAARKAETINKNITSGEIEIKAEEIIVESLADQIPFQIADKQPDSSEEIRLKYRFLDLRRKKPHENIILRSKVISFIRQLMTEFNFLEIQTPILTASSPEGARDYIVPSRIHKGQFYALPQAPQIFKQLLMTSGFDRYFQIAPCFRDEDLRSDRAPEFYQLDMEMSFVTQEDVFNVVEPLLKNVFKKFGQKKVAETAFPKITYRDAMMKYGCDKPDLRNPLIISEVSEVFKDSNFSIFAKSITKGMTIRAIPAPKCGDKPRSYFDKMISFAGEYGAKGLGYIIFDNSGEAKGPIAKFLDHERITKLKDITGIKNGDAIFFSCDEKNNAEKISAAVRIKLGEDLNLLDNDYFKFCWIVDYPMYERNNDTGKIEFSHNPFSMPQGGMEALKNKNPLDILAFQYDIVCNGIELSSGAIRNHKLEIMYQAFAIAGYQKSQIENEFSSLINAFKYGPPPHGGIAPGIDRILMILLDEPNIRETIAFPMNGKSQDLLMGSPSNINEKQLKELGIKLIK